MKWIMITGASSGIGRACALEFAKRDGDAHFLLLGRNRAALEEVKGKIGERASIHPSDLSTKEGQASAVALIKDKTPDLLINSAGFGYYGLACDHPLEEESRLVEVNIAALQMLTLTAATALKLASKRGTILNLSSAAAYLSFPGSASYASSKAFVSRFSTALDLELEGTGVRVLTFCPGVVATAFSERAAKGRPLALKRHAVILPEKAAKAIFRQVERGKRLVVYDVRYWFAVKLIPLTPKKWLGKFLRSYVS